MSQVPETRRRKLYSTRCPISGIPQTSWQTAALPWLGTGHCGGNQHLNCTVGSLHPTVVVIKTA